MDNEKSDLLPKNDGTVKAEGLGSMNFYPKEFVEAHMWANMHYPQTFATQRIIAGAVVARKILDGDLTWAQFNSTNSYPDSDINELMDRVNNAHKAHNAPAPIVKENLQSQLLMGKEDVIILAQNVAEIILPEEDILDYDKLIKIFEDINLRPQATALVEALEAASDSLKTEEALDLGKQLRAELKKSMIEHPRFSPSTYIAYQRHLNPLIDKLRKLSREKVSEKIKAISTIGEIDPDKVLETIYDSPTWVMALTGRVENAAQLYERPNFKEENQGL